MAPFDSPRVDVRSLNDVPEEFASSGRASPYVHPHLAGSASTFKAHPSTSSLASLATSSAAAKTPTGPRNPPSLRGAQTRLASDTASIAGVSITGMLMQHSVTRTTTTRIFYMYTR